MKQKIQKFQAIGSVGRDSGVSHSHRRHTIASQSKYNSMFFFLCLSHSLLFSFCLLIRLLIVLSRSKSETSKKKGSFYLLVICDCKHTFYFHIIRPFKMFICISECSFLQFSLATKKIGLVEVLLLSQSYINFDFL